MVGARLITEGAWLGEGARLGEGSSVRPSKKRVRTRSQWVRSWRSPSSKTRTGACALGHRRCCGLASRPLSAPPSPPHRLELSDRAAESQQTRVTREGGARVHRQRRPRRCSPTLPASLIWPPRLTVAPPNAAHHRAWKGSGRELGDKQGGCEKGALPPSLPAHIDPAYAAGRGP